MCLYGYNRLWKNEPAVRSVVQPGGCEMDNSLHPSIVIGSHSTHPGIVLLTFVSSQSIASSTMSVLRGGIETQGWLSLKVSCIDDLLNRRPVS